MAKEQESNGKDDPSLQRSPPRKRRTDESWAIRRKARATIEKYRKDLPVTERPVVSEKTPTVKRCQNCYFCVGERQFGGAIWCQCSNPGRSTTVTTSGSWVKSGINYPCWKPQQD